MEETTKILVWESNEGTKYYDISNDALMRGAALVILEERMNEGYIPKPRPIENHRMYQRNKQHIFNLEIVIGDSDEEAFDDMRQKLEQYRSMNRMHEQNTARTQEDWDKVKECLEKRDGAEAVRIITQRMHNYGERIELIEASKFTMREPAEV